MAKSYFKSELAFPSEYKNSKTVFRLTYSSFQSWKNFSFNFFNLKDFSQLFRFSRKNHPHSQTSNCLGNWIITKMPRMDNGSQLILFHLNSTLKILLLWTPRCCYINFLLSLEILYFLALKKNNKKFILSELYQKLKKYYSISAYFLYLSVSSIVANPCIKLRRSNGVWQSTDNRCKDFPISTRSNSLVSQAKQTQWKSADL